MDKIKVKPAPGAERQEACRVFDAHMKGIGVAVAALPLCTTDAERVVLLTKIVVLQAQTLPHMMLYTGHGLNDLNGQIIQLARTLGG